MLIRTLMTLQAANPGFQTSGILAMNVPIMAAGKSPEQVRGFYREIQRQAGALPGVQQVVLTGAVPWRDAGNFGPGFQFTAEGHAPESVDDTPRAKFRSVSPGFFAALGIRILAGRDFTEQDRLGAERVVIVSQTVAQRMFPNQDAVNRHLMWSDPLMRFISISTEPRRIVGIVADIDDENINPSPSMLVYHPFEQEPGGRILVHTESDPYALVQPITRIIRDLSKDQPVERAATLEDVRAEVLAPDRLNAIVFGGFAAVAVAISVVGVAGVLAFSVSGRTREFGVRMAIGSQPGAILSGVLREGAVMAVLGIVAGAAGGYALARVVASFVEKVTLPGALPIVASAVILLVAAFVASLLPAAKAARVDVIQALRSE